MTVYRIIGLFQKHHSELFFYILLRCLHLFYVEFFLRFLCLAWLARAISFSFYVFNIQVPICVSFITYFLFTLKIISLLKYNKTVMVFTY